ncbi:hypothetical protein [Sorangium sp. So ce341]|uniref:hypothetical protein n=1 Tax=Sorangium sp. So ce341 TaxID=3133302 RepID=UPI003F5F19C5
MVAVVSTSAGATEVPLLDAMSGGSPSWRLSTGLLAEFAIEKLKQASASEYNELRAILGAGMQNVVVTGGELTTKVTMQLSTPGDADPAAAAQQVPELEERPLTAAEKILARRRAPGATPEGRPLTAAEKILARRRAPVTWPVPRARDPHVWAPMTLQFRNVDPWEASRRPAS